MAANNAIINAIIGAEAPSISQYEQAYQSAITGGLQNVAGAQALGGLMQGATGLSEAQNQLSLGANALQQQGAYQQYLNQFGQLELQKQQYNLQGTEAGQAYQNTAQQLGLETNLAQQQLGLAGTGFSLQKGAEGLQEQGIGYQEQALGLQQAQLNYLLPQQIQAQQGTSAAAGASQTVGARNALGQIQEQYGTQTGLIGTQMGQAEVQRGLAENQLLQQGVQYQGQVAGLQEQLGQYGLQGTENLQGYQNALAQLNLQQQGVALSEQGATQGYQNQAALLSNAAQSLGVSGEQLQNQLAQQLVGLQQQTAQAGAGYAGQAAQAAGGVSQGLGAILMNAGVTGGFSPQQFAGAFPGLYG